MPGSVLQHECKWPPPAAPLLVLSLTEGSEERLRVLVSHLRWLPSMDEATCVIWLQSSPSEDQASVQLRSRLSARCSVCLANRVHRNFSAGLQFIAPLVGQQHPNGIFILMDDVQLEFPLLRLFERAVRHKLDTASPAVRGTWKLMAPHEAQDGEEGRLVRVIEMQSQWFSVEMWRCFAQLLDPATNAGLYGIDIWTHDWSERCLARAPRMGILDDFVVVDRRLPTSGSSDGRKDAQQMHAQSRAWLQRGKQVTVAQHMNNDSHHGLLKADGAEARRRKNGPIKVGVVIMVDAPGKQGLMAEGAWESAAGLLDVHVTHWPTVPCVVGDVRNAPIMSSKGAQMWMDSKTALTPGKPSWWCAQRGHLRGVRQLIQEAGDAEYYLLLDHDSRVFPRAMGRLMRLLRNSEHDDLYAGHLTHPSWVGLRPDNPLHPMLVPFIASGGGVLLRGCTLQRLRDTGKLALFEERQSSGDLKWAALDWTFGMAMASIGVTARGHAAFQQFTGSDLGLGSCDPACVVCHQYDRICDPQTIAAVSVDKYNTRRTGQNAKLNFHSNGESTALSIAKSAVGATLGPAARCAPTGHDANATAHEEAFQVLWKRLNRARWSSPCALGEYPASPEKSEAHHSMAAFGHRFVSQCGWEGRAGPCGLG